jgi:hypothetical protein
MTSLSRNGKAGTPGLLISPNSVLANALLRSIDILRPRVLATRPSRIEFVVGTQINGAPHLGTNLVQTAAFLLAKIARREFSIDTVVRFGALDNAPHDVTLDPETHHTYSSPGCWTPTPGLAVSMTTSTRWSGWSENCSPTRNTSSARSPSRS